jgi:3-oxoacyl-[acyl-carrier-protein] synthase II
MADGGLRGLDLALKEPQARDTRLRVVAVGVRLAKGLLGPVTVAEPQPDGRWEALVMQQALERSDLPEEVAVDAVYAHGTGTPVGDTAELRAVNTVFAERVADVKVTSLTGAIGHSGGAAAAMNLVAALVGMGRGEVLPTANTTTVDPEVGFEVVLDKPWRGEVRAVQLNGFGFGGQNASMVVSAA